MNAVDTNVFVYALDADEPVKKAKAVALLDVLVGDQLGTSNRWPRYEKNRMPCASGKASPPFTVQVWRRM